MLGAIRWKGDLPFLFKVISISKALSIQAHPDKVCAKSVVLSCMVVLAGHCAFIVCPSTAGRFGTVSVQEIFRSARRVLQDSDLVYTCWGMFGLGHSLFLSIIHGLLKHCAPQSFLP